MWVLAGKSRGIETQGSGSWVPGLRARTRARAEGWDAPPGVLRGPGKPGQVQLRMDTGQEPSFVESNSSSSAASWGVETAGFPAHASPPHPPHSRTSHSSGHSPEVGAKPQRILLANWKGPRSCHAKMRGLERGGNPRSISSQSEMSTSWFFELSWKEPHSPGECSNLVTPVD